MTVNQFLTSLRMMGAQFVLDGDRLHVDAPAGVLTDEHRRELRERKAQIVAFLRTAQQLAGQPRAIVPLKASGTGIPIFAIGGHNGDVFCYRSLVQHLDAEQPFYGLQPPGLEEGSTPCASVEELAGYFADQVQAFQPEGSLALAGYCAGGTIAFELARQLQTSGTAVSRLILFGAPYLTSYNFWPDLVDGCINIVRGKIAHIRRLLGSPASERRRDLADSVQRRVSGIGKASRDPVMVRRHILEKATVTAIRHYSAGFFDGHMDLMVPNEAWARSLAKPLHWRDHAATSTTSFGPDDPDCNGYTMLSPEHAATFASLINATQNSSYREAPS